MLLIADGLGYILISDNLLIEVFKVFHVFYAEVPPQIIVAM